jgi:hypothetical protein
MWLSAHDRIPVPNRAEGSSCRVADLHPRGPPAARKSTERGAGVQGWLWWRELSVCRALARLQSLWAAPLGWLWWRPAAAAAVPSPAARCARGERLQGQGFRGRRAGGWQGRQVQQAGSVPVQASPSDTCSTPAAMERACCTWAGRACVIPDCKGCSHVPAQTPCCC